MSLNKEIEKSHAAELSSYLKYKRRILESVSEGDVKRKRNLNYFDGNGVKEWDPKSKLIVKDINFTKYFLKFRSRNIILAEKINSVNMIRLLSLSHIFPVDKFNSNLCVSNYCNPIKKHLHDFAYGNIKFEKVGIEAIYYCKQLVDALDEDSNIKEIKFEPDTTIDINVKEATLEFVNVAAASDSNSESTFTDKYILPFIRKVALTYSNFSYSIIDGYDDKSKKKPDVVIGFRDRKKRINGIFFEIKRPGISSKYQEEADYVKLLKQLKLSIDYQVDLNIISPISFGIHCEGFECSLIQMKVVEDGVYLATTLRKFKLPRDTTSLLDIPRVVECFKFTVDELVKLESRYRSRTKKEITVEHGFVKKSFITKFS